VSAAQLVFAATAAAVAVSIALVTAGVALLAGAGWSMITGGTLIGSSAVMAAVVLLRDGGTTG